MLCRKAAVPAADVRGNITSYRARSTIASQLYNAKEPTALFELQAWLGHRSPQSTASYAKISPRTLTRAYDDAGYFARNVRTTEVLIDRDAVASGAVLRTLRECVQLAGILAGLTGNLYLDIGDPVPTMRCAHSSAIPAARN